MGKFDFNIDPALVRQLERLDNFDKVAVEVLEEGAKVLEPFVKREVAKHKHTGRLYESIKASKPKKNKHGYFISVRPTGTDKKGVRNMQKMAHLEYGTKNQPARPVLTKALNDAREPVHARMQEVINKIIEEE